MLKLRFHQVCDRFLVCLLLALAVSLYFYCVLTHYLLIRWLCEWAEWRPKLWIKWVRSVHKRSGGCRWPAVRRERSSWVVEEAAQHSGRADWSQGRQMPYFTAQLAKRGPCAHWKRKDPSILENWWRCPNKNEDAQGVPSKLHELQYRKPRQRSQGQIGSKYRKGKRGLLIAQRPGRQFIEIGRRLKQNFTGQVKWDR